MFRLAISAILLLVAALPTVAGSLVLENPRLAATGHVEITLKGEASMPCVTEGSEDLKVWSPLAVTILDQQGVGRFAMKRTQPAATVFMRARRSGSAEELTARIIGATSLSEAVAATQEVLAWAGAATAEPGETRVQAVEPVAAVTFSLLETYHLAMDARNRRTTGRVTLAELGQMLKDFGWPFSSDATPGEQLRSFLSLWVSEAQKASDFPQDFTPLFLAQMAKCQQPPLDLATGNFDPEALHLTLLDLHLFVSAFDRALTPRVGPARLPTTASRGQVRLMGPPAPCSALNDWMTTNSYFGVTQAGAASAGVARGEFTSKGLEMAVKARGWNAESLGKGMAALSISAKIWKLVLLYSKNQVSLRVATENPVHKPLPSETPKTAEFVVLAGVSDEDWNAYQKARTSASLVRGLRDCASFYGLTLMPDLGDIGAEADKWRVTWSLTQGSPEHAWITLDKNKFLPAGQGLGSLKMALSRAGSSSASATATLVADITTEQNWAHIGRFWEANVTAKAELDTSSPPGLGAVVNAIKGVFGDALALADAYVEIGAGWFQSIVRPKAYATLAVEYHEPPPLELEFDATLRGSGTVMSTSHATAKALLKYTYDKEGGYYTGEGTLNYTTTKLPGNDCESMFAVGQGAISFSVLRLTIRQVPGSQVPTVEMFFSYGRSTERLIMVICDPKGGRSESGVGEGFWTVFYTAARVVTLGLTEAESAKGIPVKNWTYEGGVPITNWGYENGSVFARAKTSSNPGGEWFEESNFVLKVKSSPP